MYKRFINPGIFFIISVLLFAGNSNIRTVKSQWLAQTIFLPFVKTLEVYNSIQELKRENFTLRNNVTKQALENLALKNQLRALLSDQSFRFELTETPFVMAEVIGFSGQFHDRNLIIDKGSRHGLEVDCPVVSAEGIIGKLIVVNNNNSIILPLNHSQFQLAVMDKNTNVQGILQSDLFGNTSMNLIKLGSQVSIGDTIVTSNLSRLFPKGYPVGKVIRIKESQDNLFLSAQIVSFTLIENLEHVFVLKKTAEKKIIILPSDSTEQDTTRTM